MSWFVVDVETDGPVAGLFSMHQVGIVKVADLSKTFYGTFKPIGQMSQPEALAISNLTLEDLWQFDDPKETTEKMAGFISEHNEPGTRVTLISDNNGFDAPFVNYYCWLYLGHSPFGWSSRRIGDIWAGLNKHATKPWKHLRETKHTHHPVDDAMGNAEVLLKLQRDYGLKVNF